MSTLEFISSLIKTITWPIVILTIVILLKQPIIKILSNLNKVTFNNLEMDFQQKLDQLESTLENKELTENVEQPINKREKEIITVAQISPTASITMAWSIIEQEILSTIKRLRISADYPYNNSPLKNINLLKDQGLIDLDTESTLHELRTLRNNAVHGKASDESITYLEAIKYYELAIKITIILKNIKE